MFDSFLLKFSLSSSIVSVVAISPTGKYPPVLSPSVIIYPVFIKFVVTPSNSSPLYALSLFSENIFFKLSSSSALNLSILLYPLEDLKNSLAFGFCPYCILPVVFSSLSAIKLSFLRLHRNL